MATTALSPGVITGSISPTGTTGDPNRPDQKSAAYERMIARAERCRALMVGVEAIRAGEEDYLPRFDEETDDSYAMRLNLAAGMGSFPRVVLASVGMLLQQPPELGDDMPAALKTLAENVDGAGTHLDVFTWNLLVHAIVDGRAGVLVDYQRVENPERTSLADEQAQGLRPYFVLFESPDIYLAHYEAINGVRVLTLLVLREVVERRVGRFGVAPVTRFRIYSREGPRITFEVWESPPNDPSGIISETVPPTPMRNVDAIPFHLFNAGQEIAPGEVKPPLLDLAELVIEHHQIKTDIRHLEMLACVPTLVRVGYIAPQDANGDPDPAPVILGPRSVQDVPAIQGVAQPLYWLTPDINVLTPAMQTLQNNEQAQGAAGLSFLSPDTRAAETAKAKQIDAAAQNATIVTIGRRAGDCLEAAFGFAGQFIRETAGSVTINSDFEATVMDAQMVSALGTLAANGKLDLETLLLLLEQGKVLPEGTDTQAIIRRILTEQAPPPTTDANGDPLPDGSPPGGKRPTKATITDTASGRTHTITTE
jgi:hypothetical protein